LNPAVLAVASRIYRLPEALDHDRTAIHRMGIAGCKRYEELFTIEKACGRFENVLLAILGK